MKTTPTLSPDALLAFDALARHGSFTAAAEALHCAKSRISQLIKELEQELGTVLVLRNTRRVALTESGQRLAAHATRLRELLDSVRHDIEQARDSVEGVLRIGCSAGLAQQLLGPLLADAVGLSGLFLATAVMGAFALLVCLRYVPRAGRAERQLPSHYLPHLLTMLRHPELMRLNIGIFCLHLVMTACFVVLPPLLVSAGLPASRHGWLYLPVMALALVALVPAVIIAEKRRRMREIYLLAVMLLGLSMLLLALGHAGLTGLVLAVALFFFAFNLLEALLPSLVSKLSPAGGKGTAMGVYSTCQFLGAFLGGALGGALQGWYGVGVLFICLAVMVLLWLVGAFAMRQPAYLHSLTLRPAEGGASNDLLERLRAAPGVAELVLLPDDGDIHLKIDRLHWRAEVLEGLPVSVVG